MSMLQFNGQVRGRRVRLEFTVKGEEPIDCPVCGQKHQRVYTAWRRPAGVWGHLTVFRYGGQENVPDLSIPIEVDKPPFGSRALSPEASAEVWHS